MEEINAVRKRAYGEDYFNAHPEVQYPNDNDAALYADNKSVKPDNVGAMEAVLKNVCVSLWLKENVGMICA